MSLFNRLKPKLKGKNAKSNEVEGQNHPTTRQIPWNEAVLSSPKSQFGAVTPVQSSYRIIGDGDRILAPGEAAPRIVYDKSQPQPASFKMMNVSIEVWRPGCGNVKKDELHYGALSNCLRGLNEPWLESPNADLAQDYLLVRFCTFFEHIINRKVPKYPVEMKHCRLRYEYKGDLFEINDQDGFEVALNDLMRVVQEGLDDYLRFTLQTETREAAISRRVDDVLIATSDTSSISTRPTSVLSQERAIQEEKPMAVANTSSSFPPFAEQAGSLLSPSQLTRGRSASFGNVAALPPRNLSSIRRPASAHGKIPTGNTIYKVLHRTTSVINGQPPDTKPKPGLVLLLQPLSRSSLPSPRSPKKLSEVLKRVSKRESKEEERKRFATLFTEETRTAYAKGGPHDDGIELKRVVEVDKKVEEEESEFPEGKEAEEYDDITQEDHVAARLQDLLNSQELTQLKCSTLEDGQFSPWEECCLLFSHDPTDTRTHSTITIAGLKTQIYQYQAFGVYWQMLTARRLGGGFVSDEMGLGKTLSFLAYFVVERQLCVRWRDVKESRNSKDPNIRSRHLSLEEAELNPRMECPEGYKKGWIPCPCSKTSLTRLMVPQPGLRMACVPSQLVSSWWTQWKSHIDTDNSILGLKIIIDHKGALANASLEDQKSGSQHAQIKTRMRADLYSIKSVSKDDKKYDNPKAFQEGWLLLTTKETYPLLAKNFETKSDVRDPKKPGAWVKGTRISLIFGIAMIDESHEEYFRNKGRAGILAQLPTEYSPVVPFLWGYSGTPFSQTPRGLEGVLWAMEKHARPSWAVNPMLKPFLWRILDQICKRYDDQAKSKERDDAAVTLILLSFQPFLTNFMLRRTGDTLWFGSSLVALKPHIHQDVSLRRQNPSIADRIPEFEAKFQSERNDTLVKLQYKFDNYPELRRSKFRPSALAFNTMSRTYWRSRLLSIFPYLLVLAEASQESGHRVDLTEEEVLGVRGNAEKEKASPYSKNLAKIVENSPKCLWLYEFLTKLDEKGDGGGMHEEKLIILSEFTQVCFILKLFIRRYFPSKKDRIGLLVGRTKLSEKNDIIDAFKDTLDAKGKRKSKHDFQILIGCTRYVGVGLHLARASTVILMEPDYDFGRQVQAYARVHRIGQKNPRSFSYRLIDAGSDIEAQIIKRQRDRKETFGKLIVGPAAGGTFLEELL